MEVAKIVEAAANYDKSVYIRLMDKTNIPVVYTEDYEFEIGKAVRLIEGGEVALLANGPLVNVALKASKKYTEETGVNVAVYDFHTVKPIDEALLNELADNVKSIITLEEHSVIGGLGSAVADYYSDKSVRPLVYKMGLPDAFPHGASHETILAEFNLTVDGVYNKIKEVSK
jgi:transketolase